MAEFYNIEDTILNQMGLFIKEATISDETPSGVKMFLLDRDWPRIEEEYVGLQVTNINRTGRSFYPDQLDTQDRQIAINWYEVLLEVMSFRGRPTSRLMQITHSFEHINLKRKHLLDFGIGVSQVSSVAKADTVLDGAEKELRARMTVVLNIGVSDADPIPSVIAEKLFVNVKTTEEGGNYPLNFTVNPSWIYWVTSEVITYSNLVYEHINYELPLDGTWEATWV
jgi:hypothetical protein